MFCNRRAYDSMLKYIPYDTFEFMENDNEFLMWSKYKLDVMKTIGDDFIHLDPDISLFKKVLDPFINGECDVLVQDVVPHKYNSLKPFVYGNKAFLADTLILTKPFDGGAMSCGTVGINRYAQEYYFAGIDVLYKAMLEAGTKNISYPSLVLEEQLLYVLSIENDFKVNTIVPHELMREDILQVEWSHGYLHIWMQIKYKKCIIEMIRRRIFFEYPEYYGAILKYEHDVLSRFKFFPYFNFPLIYS